MTLRKRRKSSRYPGTKTHGRGRKNRTRGLGNRGGLGLSGTGKRGDQKKTLVINAFGNTYFGKDQRGKGLQIIKRTPSMSLNALANGINGLVKKGIAKESKDKESYEIHLEKYKIIGNTHVHNKLVIHAKEASAGAISAVKKSGGDIILSSPKL